MGTGDTLIRDFERETRTYIDVEEQIKREDREDLELRLQFLCKICYNKNRYLLCYISKAD